MENQSAPDAGAGQGSSGDSATPSSANGQAEQTQQTGMERAQTSQVPPEGDWGAKFQNLADNYNRKITELSQGRSELEKKLQSIEQAQQQRNEALAKALGYAPQEESQPDVLSQLVDNPDWLNQQIEQRLQQKLAPIEQTLQMKDLESFAANQAVEKQEIQAELTNQVGKEMAEKIISEINVSHLVPAEVLQMNQRLQNDTMLSPQEKEQMARQVQAETWKALQKAGGYRELVNSALGKTLRSDLPGFIQSAARTYQQNQYQQGRANTFGGYTGGAGSQSSSGGTSTIQSESIYK